jgi:hypothetical protein
LDATRHESALALPIFVEAEPTSGREAGSCRVIDGSVLTAPVPAYTQLKATEDNPAKDSWRAFATEWANYARALLLNHNRHLGDESLQHIKSVALSVDLGASDSILRHVFGSDDPIPAGGRSASALFATAFAAAIMNRQMPKIAIIGDLVRPVDGPVDARRGPEIGQVDTDGLAAKISHVYLGEGYDALIVPRAEEWKDTEVLPDDTLDDGGEQESVKSPRIPTFGSGVLSNVWDIAFPNSWRRYRSIRCPEASFFVKLEQASIDRIRDWFERAEVVDNLPEWITIAELASYLRWCSSKVASLNPAPPGLSLLFMRLTEFETGLHALLSLGEAMQYPVSRLAKCDAEDSEKLRDALADMLQAGQRFPETSVGQAPDLMILVSEPQAINDPEPPIAEVNLAALLKGSRDSLFDRGRRREWSDYVGRCRIILVQERHEAERKLQLSELYKAQTELSIFRIEFTQQQASAVVSETKWHGAGAKILLEKLREQGAARYSRVTDSWILTRKAVLSANASERASLHERAGRSFASPLLCLGSPGLPFLQSQRREVITEAIYHFTEAARDHTLAGKRDSRAICRNLLADLTAAFNPATWQVIRFASSRKLEPTEPFIAMGHQLHSRAPGLPSDWSGRSLIWMISRRLDQLAVQRKQDGNQNRNHELEELAAFASRLITDVGATTGGDRPMEGMVSEILEHQQIRRLIKDSEQVRLFREGIRKLVQNNAADLTTIRADVLHEAIAEMFQGNSSMRLELYERVFVAGGGVVYGDLFLAMLGAAATNEEAEAILSKYCKRLDPNLIRNINAFAWKKVKRSLLSEVRRGYDRFEMFYPG